MLDKNAMNTVNVGRPSDVKLNQQQKTHPGEKSGASYYSKCVINVNSFVPPTTYEEVRLSHFRR